MISERTERTDPRTASRARLQGRFLIEAAQQLEEMAAILQAPVDEPTQEALDRSLDRLIASARALQLDDLANSFCHSKDKLEFQAEPAALLTASEAVRTAGYHVAFPPIAVIASPEEQVRLKSCPRAHSEVFAFFDSVNAYRRHVHPAGFQAVVLPFAELQTALLLPRTTPRVVVGTPDEPGFPSDVFAHHLEGVLEGPIALDPLLARVRSLTWQGLWLRPRAILLLQDEERRRRLTRLLSFKGVHVFSTSNPPLFYPMLRDHKAEIIVLDGDPVGMEIIRWLRGVRPLCRSNAVFIGDPADALLLARAGATETLSADMPLEELANYLSHRAHTPFCPTSAIPLPGRPEILQRLDEELNRTRRSQEPFTLALLDVDMPNRDLAREEVLPMVAETLRAQVRAADLLGHLGRDTFILVMLNTSAETAMTRLKALQAAVESHAQETSPYPEVSFQVGLAHTTDGIDGIVSRADRALTHARASGDRRAIFFP